MSESQTKRAVVMMMSRTLPSILMVAVLPMFKCQLMQVEVLAKSNMERELQWAQVIRMMMRSRPQLIRKLICLTTLMKESVLSQS